MMESSVRQSSAIRREQLEALRKTTAGEYDILTELGVGGMATVYLAHDFALDRKVALKVMSPALFQREGMVERFRREARTAASLTHPHIIPIYAVRETERFFYFIMKCVEGRTLDSIITEVGKLPIRMVQAIYLQIASALGYAHRQGVTHRDIKPANIMIDNEGWAVITDFGIAKVSDTEGLTLTGVTVGTPTYMSPEQCSSGEVSGASDQYSLGVVTYEMLAGKVPFKDPTLMGIMLAHVNETPTEIMGVRPECPPALGGAVMRMLAKSPQARFPTMEDAVAAIGAIPLAHDDPVRTQLINLANTGGRLVQRPNAHGHHVGSRERDAHRNHGRASGMPAGAWGGAVMRMLAKSPQARFPTMEDAVAAIGAIPLAHDDPVRTQLINLANTGGRLVQRPNAHGHHVGSRERDAHRNHGRWVFERRERPRRLPTPISSLFTRFARPSASSISL